jgi:hypothetical protein
MTTEEERATAMPPAEAARGLLRLVREAQQPEGALPSGRFWRHGVEIPF